MNRDSQPSHFPSQNQTPLPQNSQARSYDPSVSPEERYLNQASVLRYHEIISDKETTEFLDSYFSVSTSKSLNADVFFDLLLHEFFQRNPDLTHQIEEDELFKGELRKLLRDRLTIAHEENVSLDALEMSTKKNGLYGFLVDMALEADATSKLKKNMQLSELGVDELNIGNKMLNTKKEELMQYEQRLKEYEMGLVERERGIKQIIQGEYERLIKHFESSYMDKVDNMMKRLVSHEKSTKLKIKQFEAQVKEIKSNLSSVSVSGSDEKFKSKVSSLEKSNDFLKNKLQELERKLVEEQEAASKKNKNLLKKISLLEKNIKDLEGDQLTGQAITHAGSEPTSLQKLDEKQPEGKTKAQSSERADNNMQRGRSLSPQEQEELEKGGDSLKKSSKLLIKRSTKNGVIETSPGGVSKKKVSTVKTAQTSEFKVLLNVVHSLIVCLKSTLPIFAKSIEGKEPKDNNEEDHPLDLGEIFYPCFDSLIGNLTELLPIIGKQYDPKSLSSIVEIYYRLINFFFKFKVQRKFDHIESKHRLLSEFEIQNSTNKIKTSQDHINEIMVPSQVPKDNADVNFVPQTEYWKKVIKIAKPLQSSKIGIDPLSKESKGVKNKPDFVRIHLFTEEIVQKEVLSILKRFLDSTEFMLNSGSNIEKEEKNPNLIEVVSFHTKLNLETQKYLQITRLYGSLIAILLARTKKEQISGLQSLMVDLNVENVKFAEFLRLFFIENDGLNILFWIMKTHVEDFDILQVTVDILSCLNVDGAHYQQFIEVLGKEENIKTVSELLRKFEAKNEYCKKWALILQRIIAYNSIQGGNSEKYALLLKQIG